MLLNLYLDIREVLGNSQPVAGSVNGDGDTCKTNNDRTSVSGEVVTFKTLCQRYLSEDAVQRFLLPEETCGKIQVSAASGTVDIMALQQLQDYVCQLIKKE